MTSPIAYIKEGTRMIRNSLMLRAHGFYEYGGDARFICQQILDDCWNGVFFQTSTTNFPQFWTRDFGLSTKALAQHGYKEKVKKTLNYALNIFSKYNTITTTITPQNKPFNFPRPAVDSLPWFIHSLKFLNDKELINTYAKFIEIEVMKFYHQFIDKKTGLVKSSHVSSLKDFAIRKSSCYDNCMTSMLSKDLTALKFHHPLKDFDYRELLLNHFWKDTYFTDDITQQSYVAGDAQLFPFYTNTVKSKKMMRTAFSAIQENKLDFPFPLKYTTKDAPVKFIWQELFMRNYERDTIWLHIGPLYIKLLQRVDPKLAREHLKSMTWIIETYKNYPEALTSEGKPFTAPFYHCDQGMLWCANYLAL
jgi:hypothetical protein